MALPIEDRKLTKPHTTTASSALRPAEGSEKKSPAKKAATEPEIEGPFVEARKAAKEGAREVAKSTSEQPTPERRIVVGAAKAIEAGAKTVVAGAKDLKHAADKALKPIMEPYEREQKEAREEVSKAASDYGKGWWDSLNPFDEKNVQDKVSKQPTIERKIFWAGVEGAKNVFHDGVENAKNAGNLLKEVGEGAVETFLHNPLFTAQQKAGEALLGWGKDVLDGGAKGAVKAGKTLAGTQAENAKRSIEQHKENITEIKDAFGNFGDNYDRFSEVGEAWDEQPTIERKLVVAGWNIGENLFQSNVENLVDAGNVVKEGLEAGVENTITSAKNFGNSVAGGLEATGDFVGGLFGG